MRIRDNRLWAVVIAVAFLILWFVGAAVAYGSPVQEPLPQPEPSTQAEGARAVGIMGWCLVGIGFLGVALSVAFGSRPKRRRKTMRAAPRNPAKVMRSVYSPPPARRYRGNVERRF